MGIGRRHRHWPIIIGGCFRSGTTLLRRLLDSHSRIFCGPEVKFFREFHNDYLFDDLAQFRFFSTVRSLGLSDDELLGIFGKSYIESLDLACRKAGKKRWAEKTPENALHLNTWKRMLNGRFYFILIVRHPLDTLASLMENPFPRIIAKGFEAKVDIYSKYVGHGLAFINANPELCQVIRYEDLVQEPENTLSGLLSEFGESFESGMLLAFRSEERLSGVEDPKIHDERKIHTESIGRYIRDLQPNQITYAVSNLQRFFEQFGYDLPAHRTESSKD